MTDERDYDLGYSDVGYFTKGRSGWHPEPDRPLIPHVPGWAWLALALAAPAIIIALTATMGMVR